MKACVFTLGCKMNEVESASLMQGLEELGYEVTDTLSYADVYVLNTCAVTAEAEKRAVRQWRACASAILRRASSYAVAPRTITRRRLRKRRG